LARHQETLRRKNAGEMNLMNSKRNKDRFGSRPQDLVNHFGHSTTSCGFALAPTTKSANLPLAIQSGRSAWNSVKTK
jgi:hypothetical protein